MDTKELLGRVCGSVSDNEICIYNCGDGTYMRLIKNASETDFIKICDECERLGYTLFQRNDIEENIHASYRGICSSTHISARLKKFCASYATRIPLTSSAKSRNMRADAAARCGSSRTIIRISTAVCAISCAARTTAFYYRRWAFSSAQRPQENIPLLRERTPDGERAVISGWFFSHAHDDHVSQFVDFIREYGSAVDIEKLYYNDAPIDHRDNMSWGEANKNT